VINGINPKMTYLHCSKAIACTLFCRHTEKVREAEPSQMAFQDSGLPCAGRTGYCAHMQRWVIAASHSGCVLMMTKQLFLIDDCAGNIHWRNTLEQLKLVGPKSLGVSLLTAGFVGMVFTIQVFQSSVFVQ
jgi:hypothetical protein